jgi:hypothetical protein
MRTSLHLGLLIIGSVSMLAACSSDETCTPGDVGCGTTPPPGGAGGQTGGGGTGGATGGTGGATGGTGGATGGTGGAPLNLGPALTITETTVSSTAANINGAVLLINSANNAATTARGADTTKLCVNGSVGIVPGTPPDYTNNWGMQFGFNLNDVPPAGGGGPVADAGADAGDAGAAPPAGEAVTSPWTPGNVTGFSFTIEGTDIPALIRVNVAPFDAPADPPFCLELRALTTGTTRAFRFTEVTSACYNGAGGVPAAPPLRNVGWQVPADTTAPHTYDFCISNIQPVLGN